MGEKMEAEAALKDLLLEIEHQEVTLGTALQEEEVSGAKDARRRRTRDLGGDDEAAAVRLPSCASGNIGGREVEEDGPGLVERDVEDDGDGVEEDEDELHQLTFAAREVTADAVKRLSQAGHKEWWKTLPDLAYVVTKVNQYGKRQTRTIRLTTEGIENVRKNGKVSSLYPYEAVIRVYMKSVKAFVIDYKNAKHSYQYRSSVAMHIVQEITSRLALRKKEERCLTPDIATRLQEKLQQSGWDHVPRPTRATTSARRSTEDRRVQQAKKVNNLLGTTEQQRLESAIDWMVLDEHTPEGKTLKQFCHNFAVLEKNPATLAMNVRQFMDDLRAYIIERHADELAKLTLDTNSSVNQDEMSLPTMIENALERAIVARFRHRIVASLKKPSKEEEMQLKRKLAIASTKSQQFFGINEEYVSLSGWAAAISELQVLDEWDLPCKLLASILATAKSIYATLNYEKNNGKNPDLRQAIFLSADDFFPIFLFVVSRANLKNPLLVSEYLWSLCDPEQLNGEGGYYLTVFCSAFQYLKELELEEGQCQQREEEAIKYIDDKVLQADKSSPRKAEMTAASVDSYFSMANKKDLSDSFRQRTSSAPDKGEKSKSIIRQRLESQVERAIPDHNRKITIGSSECRAAQEAADEREKEKERDKELLEQTVWPTEAVAKRKATLRAAEIAENEANTQVLPASGESSEPSGSCRPRRGTSKYGTDRSPPSTVQAQFQSEALESIISHYEINQVED